MQNRKENKAQKKLTPDSLKDGQNDLKETGLFHEMSNEEFERHYYKEFGVIRRNREDG
ncbi:hypothetical protein [Metabacillus fastidiosus]|uniref:hypothetical protein n=1 Tax=Metabacillus fastidiosus TaxID=1458 RepID=UPI000A5056A7|nr:hypothetical protein [Metabacillus fastidiosus]MED4462709.1 hypothetical protein [Metabacillus fastidiosus]